MNDVEEKHNKLSPESLSSNDTETISSILNGNDTMNSILNATDAIINNATELPLSDATVTTMAPNLTVVGTMLKTTIVMQNLTANETESQEMYNHPFYIYIWAIAILGCILLTTGR